MESLYKIKKNSVTWYYAILCGGCLVLKMKNKLIHKYCTYILEITTISVEETQRNKISFQCELNTSVRWESFVDGYNNLDHS